MDASIGSKHITKLVLYTKFHLIFFESFRRMTVDDPSGIKCFFNPFRLYRGVIISRFFVVLSEKRKREKTQSSQWNINMFHSVMICFVYKRKLYRIGFLFDEKKNSLQCFFQPVKKLSLPD